MEGWQQWAREIIATIGICENREALAQVQDRHRDMLKAIAREKRTLYNGIGAAFSSRLEALETPKPPSPSHPAGPARKPPPAKRNSRRSKAALEKELIDA